MPIALHHEGGDTYRLDISGRVERPEYVRLEGELAATLARVGGVRLLCVLEDFEGFGSSEAWSNLDFYAKHGDAIRRIAIVGKEQWRDESLMFAAADLRKAPVQYFVEADLAGARRWLAS
jgi:hypothetical protein